MNKLLIEKGFDESEITDLYSCFRPTKKNYGKGELIMGISGENDEVGIITEGTAYLVSINGEGQKSIVNCYRRGDVFGSRFSPDSLLNAYYIVAHSPCDITYISYKKLTSCCEKCCSKHVRLLDFFINTSVRRWQIHIDILSQRTIRGRLMYYFSYLSAEEGKSAVKLPMSLSDLADYLSIDRSAMMREIKKLNADGVIRSKGTDIEVLQVQGNTVQSR